MSDYGCGECGEACNITACPFFLWMKQQKRQEKEDEDKNSK